MLYTPFGPLSCFEGDSDIAQWCQRNDKSPLLVNLNCIFSAIRADTDPTHNPKSYFEPDNTIS